VFIENDYFDVEARIRLLSEVAMVMTMIIAYMDIHFIKLPPTALGAVRGG